MVFGDFGSVVDDGTKSVIIIISYAYTHRSS